MAHARDHTREIATGEYEDESLIDLLDAILRDQFVLFQQPGADSDRLDSVLDLRDPHSLLEELTHPLGSDPISIKSFTGAGDREVTLADLED